MRNILTVGMNWFCDERLWRPLPWICAEFGFRRLEFGFLPGLSERI